MKIKKIDKGMVAANCYIVYKDNEAIVIDPGVKQEYIIEFLNKHNLTVKYIVYTHAHIDHILYANELQIYTNAPIIVHELDNDLLIDSYKNGAYLFGLDKKFNKGDLIVSEGDTIEFADIVFKIIHTPGHTPGGICLLSGNHLFTGDTLFYLSIGRTDLGMGSAEQITDSIKNKLFLLDDDVIVYPGHGKNTTIGFEKTNNVYV